MDNPRGGRAGELPWTHERAQTHPRDFLPSNACHRHTALDPLHPSHAVRYTVGMEEVQPITIETIVEELRHLAVNATAPLIIDARLAVTREETRLLAVHPAVALEVIHY